MADVNRGETSGVGVGAPCAYDIFLSFRGEDTRKNFTERLYAALVETGLRTFRDDNEIERGEDIKSELDKAIHQSRSSIIVLSENYATSSWCLDELVMILENRKSKGHAVLPIFYLIDPSQVREQRGSFARAFARHEKRFLAESDEDNKEWMDRVERWRTVLKEVANIGGMVLQNQSDAHEVKFIEKVTKMIEDKVNRSVLSIAPYLIGINSRVKHINFWLKDQAADTGILGICGVGGIGKTTTAKYVFNLNCEKFEASCFLENVREFSEHTNGLVKLQKQFLCDILHGRKPEVQNIDEGINQIKDAVFGKRVLVVLDDIDQVEQLDALLGNADWFCPGSKIIVTTRYPILLEDQHIYKIHNVEKLNDDESSELFSWHAFGQDHPNQDYKDISRRIIQHCGGLPLALQVLGSSLSGKSLEVWESTWKKLEAIPNNQVDRKLRISYDALQDDHDKNLFLEIACFFVRRNRDYVATILDECDYFTKVGIQNLADRCLLTVNEYNKLVMHHLIIDMAREIIRLESPKHPGKRTRLWHYKDSLRVLIEQTGSDTVLGLSLTVEKDKFPKRYDKGAANEPLLEVSHKIGVSHEVARAGSPLEQHRPNLLSCLPMDSKSNNLNIKTDAFSMMRNLRLLQLDNIRLNGHYKEFPKKLRWLSWPGFPFKCVHDGFPLDNLVVLEMRYSRLERYWKQKKVLRLLKILDLSYSNDLRKTPDFSKLPNLERLKLKHCQGLEHIDESVGELKRLVVLNLRGCANLKKLPRNMSQLQSLRKLSLSGCSKLDMMSVDLGKLQSLTVLCANETAIEQAPSSMHTKNLLISVFGSLVSRPREGPKSISSSLLSLCSLLTLSLTDCNLSSDSLLQGIPNLSLLEKLCLNRNPIHSLPENLKHLSRLKSLELDDCDRLLSVPELPASVTSLGLHNCRSVRKLTNLPNLLSSLDLLVFHCYKLCEVEGLFMLKPIENYCRDMVSVLGLFNLESLSKVTVDLYNNLTLVRMKLPVQGLYEFGIFSTSIPGERVPGWYTCKTTGSVMCFQVPSLPDMKIQGLNVCVVYDNAGKNYREERNKFWNEFHIRIANKTKNLRWTYSPTFKGIPDPGKCIIWLSHWKIGDHLDGDDELSISVTMFAGYRLKEFGLNIVFKNTEKGDAEAEGYSYSQHQIDGVDLSSYEVAKGCYFLNFHDFDVNQECSVNNGWYTDGWYDFLFGDSSDTVYTVDEAGRTKGYYEVQFGSSSKSATEILPTSCSGSGLQTGSPTYAHTERDPNLQPWS